MSHLAGRAHQHESMLHRNQLVLANIAEKPALGWGYDDSLGGGYDGNHSDCGGRRRNRFFGFRFRVMVLVETIVIAATFIVMIGFGDGYSIPAIAVAVVGITTSLQVGYVAGCLIQLLPIAKARRHYSTSKPVIDT